MLPRPWKACDLSEHQGYYGDSEVRMQSILCLKRFDVLARSSADYQILLLAA